jgi:hypothetical protein
MATRHHLRGSWAEGTSRNRVLEVSGDKAIPQLEGIEHHPCTRPG